jgi:hypothetical protein
MNMADDDKPRRHGGTQYFCNKDGEVVGAIFPSTVSDETRPSERDMIGLPVKPDLRCEEHGSVCKVVHSLHQRLVQLESKVRKLERKELEDDR